VAKERLDVMLVQAGLAESREKAQRVIRTGRVRVNGQVQSKPGQSYKDDVEITVENPDRFVSRGGEKLLGALEKFPITLEGKIGLDIGSSTGGFTDCMLQHGAAKVYAVDVGKGQLHWKLRNNERVVVMEEVNARYLKPEDFPEKADFMATDVSFISLTKILPAVTPLIHAGGEMMTLIKPQFEAGPEKVGKGGVVRDPAVHQEVIERVRHFGTEELGLQWLGLEQSPLKGPAGNIEFLAHWKVPE
jgi:23S rRNA (cytidine1920-2'-O)/16S rRNA (cytidine1409-2'-O)-methyltransferase